MSEGKPGWAARIFGGFRKTSERLSENLSGIVVGATRLDDDQLDALEDGLILSDLGPRAAERIRNKLAEERFDRGASDEATTQASSQERPVGISTPSKPSSSAAWATCLR